MLSRRSVPVAGFDASRDRWVDVDAAGSVDRDALTVTTFNVWFDPYFAERRYRAIADELAALDADVMVFQEVTRPALAILCSRPWVRENYRRVTVAGGLGGNYGLLTLSRLPIIHAVYRRLPTGFSRVLRPRGFLLMESNVNGSPLSIASIHLESGKAKADLRERQLRRIYDTLEHHDDAVVLGDFNMRDKENDRIDARYVDVWPALRPDENGYTEDTSINLMRYDSRNKKRHVRFDRVLLKSAAWSPESIDLFGTQPISADLPRVFPSDHFGVRCRLARVR